MFGAGLGETKLRTLIGLFICLAFMLAAREVHAGDQVLYGSAPAWVKAAPIPASDEKFAGSIELLLLSQQEFLGPQSHSRYVETAVKVRSPQGLQEAGMFAASWDPAISDLTIVKAEIIRDGQSIDLLAGGDRFSTLRRERNLSAAVIDGTLTAIMEAKGLRVGDTVHLQALIDVKDPVLGAHRETLAAFASGRGVIGRLHLRQLWPTEVPMRWKATEGYLKNVKETHGPFGTELEVDLARFQPVEPPAGAPTRYGFASRVELSAFKDWTELSRLMAPAYVQAASLSPTSPLKAEAEKIRAAHSTSEGRALAALRLVEHDVRYLALVLNAGGLVPASADETWTRRFGDCKAKTALLIALLTELGIEAKPALVAAEGGYGMNDGLPRVGAFDHVIVRAQIEGRTYWLDGTRPTDRSLVSLSGLPFVFALPLSADGTDLEKIDWPVPAKPLREELQQTDISAGVDGKVPSKFAVILRGDEGLVLDLLLSQLRREEAAEGLKEHFRDETGWLDIEKVDFRWDDAEEGLRVEFEGKGRFGWRQAGSRWTVGLTDSIRETFEERKDGSDSAAPYALVFPYHYSETIRVLLPKGQVRRDLTGADEELTAGGVHYLRRSKVVDGSIEVTQTQRVLKPELSAGEAMAGNRALEASPFFRMAMLTYGAEGVGGAVQAQVSDLIRLAAQNIERRNTDEALTYLNRALTLDASNGEALRLRYSINAAAARNLPQALTDARTLVRLQPSAQAYALEAAVLGQMGQYRQALARAEEAIKLDADYFPPQRARIGALVGLGRYGEIISTLDGLADQGVASRPLSDLVLDVLADVARQPVAQQAAFARTMAAEPQSASARVLYGGHLVRSNRALARSQFEQALLIRPDFPVALRMRAALEIEERNYEAALKDIDLVEKVEPDDPSARVMRGEVLALMNQTDRALAEYQAMLQRDPANPALHNQICWRRVTGGGDPNKALAECSEALRLRPGYAQALDSRGLVNLKLGRYAEAIADYDGSLKDRTYAGSLYGRGLAKQKAGDIEGGETDIARAIQLNPRVAAEFEAYGLKP